MLRTRVPFSFRSTTVPNLYLISPVLYSFVTSLQVSENYEMYASQGKGVPVVG